MLFFLITCFSFIFFYKSLSLKPLPLWACEMRLLSLWFWKDLSLVSLLTKSIKNSFLASFASEMLVKNKTFSCKIQKVDELSSEMSVLDLPELVLECILERLPPEGLCSMASVCSSLRDRCMSDHLWDRHLKQKWGRIIGPAAYREWQWHIATRKDSCFFNQAKQRGFLNYLSQLWPFTSVRSNLKNRIIKQKNLPPVDSVMSRYLALESGKFWFPAQVYNREVLFLNFQVFHDKFV